MLQRWQTVSQSTAAEENEDRNQPDRTLIRLLTVPVPAELRLVGITSRPNRLTQTQKSVTTIEEKKHRDNLSPARRNCNRKRATNTEDVSQSANKQCRELMTCCRQTHRTCHSSQRSNLSVIRYGLLLNVLYIILLIAFISSQPFLYVSKLK